MAICCLAFIGASIFAWQQRSRANLETNAKATAQANEEIAVVTSQAEKSRADEQTQIAIGNNIVVQAQEMEIIDVKLLLCIQGYKLSPSSEALSCIFDVINTNSNQGQIEINLGKIEHHHENQITDLAINNSGEYMFAGSIDGVVSMWDINNELSFIKNLPIQFNEITSLGVAPDSGYLAISDTDNNFVLLDTLTDEIIWEQKANDLLPINKLLFDNSGNVIITGGGKLDVVSGKKGEILFWNTKDGSLVGNQLQDLQYPVTDLALNPEGQILASGFYQTGGFDVLRFWDVKSRSALSDSISAHSNAIVSLSFNPSGSILATGAISPGSASEGGDVILWDGHTFDPMWNLDEYPRFAGRMATKSSQITDLSFSSNGKFLFSNWGNRQESGIAVWDINTFEILNTYIYNSLFSVESLLTSPDGLSLYAGMSNGEILELDISDSSFQPIQQLLDDSQAQSPEFASMVFFEDENTLLSSGNGGLIKWDTKTKGAREIIDENNISIVPDEFSTEAISPDKKIMARATTDNSVELIDIASNEQLVILHGHNDTIEKLAFTPDGKFLISTGFRDKIVVWDVYSYAKLLEHGIPVQFVDSLSISPDSKQIAVALNTAPKFGGASEIILINIDFDLWTKTGCNISNRNFTEDEWLQYIGPEIPYQATCP